jgi:hydrogenase maturation protease
MVAVPDRPILVIGVGNRLRGDDGASWQVVPRLCERGTRTGAEVNEQLREPDDSLEAWQDRNAVGLIDTMSSGEPPGTIRRSDVSGEPLPTRFRGSVSMHGFGLHDAIELDAPCTGCPGG